MTWLTRIAVLPGVAFVMGVLVLIFIGCCAAAFWEWIRNER